MGMYLGETEFTGFYLGDTELTHLYVGDNEVWGSSNIQRLTGVFCPGLSYIRTNINHGNSYKLEIDCSMNFYTIFGQRSTYGYSVMCDVDSGKYKIYMKNETPLTTSIPIGTRCVMEIDHDAKTISVTPKAGGTTETLTVTGAIEPTNSVAKFLFGCDNNLYYTDAPFDGGMGIVYGAKIWFGDVLQAELVPAMYKGTMSGIENPVGLYDSVNDIFYVPTQKEDQTSYPATDAPFVDARYIGSSIPGWVFTNNPKGLSGSAFNPSSDTFIANNGYYDSSSAFYITTISGNKSDQIRIVDGNLQIEGYAHIKRGMMNRDWLFDWSTELIIDDFANSAYAPSPATYLGRIFNMDFPACEVYFDFTNNRLGICPYYTNSQRTNMTTYGNYGPTMERDRMNFSGITLSILQNGPHNFKIGKRGNTIYWFFDDTLLCSWVVETSLSAPKYICLGTWETTGHNTPIMTIRKFAVHDNWQYEDLINDPT